MQSGGPKPKPSDSGGGLERRSGGVSAPLTSEKSRSKRCKACSDVEGTVKIDVLIFSQQTETPRNGPSGPHRKCGVQAFC